MFTTFAHFLAYMAKASLFLFCHHTQISLFNLCLPSKLVGNWESQNHKAMENVTLSSYLEISEKVRNL